MKNFVLRNMGFIVTVTLVLVIRGSFADQNVVPSGSMEPTIHVGDHILVNKLAYDLHLPYSKVVLATIGEPQRGDIIVFHNPVSDIRMVKRLVALPGDKVRIRDGFVWVNGEANLSLSSPKISAHKDEIFYYEKIGKHSVTLKRTPGLFRPDHFEFEVPKGQYFAMGDNRDNSSDSRVWGFIPRSHLEGRAVGVIYNLSWSPLPTIDGKRAAMALD